MKDNHQNIRTKWMNGAWMPYYAYINLAKWISTNPGHPIVILPNGSWGLDPQV